MSEQRITCQECGDVFAFSEAEQAFYAEKGLASPPKRCKACRQARKAARGGGGGGGGERGPRRYSNDVNEYRSPMTGGRSSFGQEWARGGERSGGAQSRPRRSNGNGYGGGGGYGGAPRANANANGNGGGEYRSPAFPESRHGGGGGGAPRSRDAREPRDAAPKAPRQPRPERPKYDIVCATCGAAAQVPFKPLEGRQVFCQECYRARRATGQAAAPAPDVTSTDTGIVE
jgi:CxxC-x17-CxxC domain-containing protein